MSDDDVPHADATLAARLADGVARGIITAAQRDALLALDVAAHVPDVEASPATHRRRPWTVVAVAYALGAGLVVAALAWFVAERWERLGPAGVLVVAGVYAAIFAVTARALAAQRFPTAAGVATALVVATVPLAAWAVLRLVGEWPADTLHPWAAWPPYMATRRLVVALATLDATLVALRVVRPSAVDRAPLGVPLAAASAAALVLTGEALAPVGLFPVLDGLVMLAAGAVLFAAAYHADRACWAARAEDLAGWLYVAAVALAQLGVMVEWPHLGAARHLLPVAALALLAAGVRLGRRLPLVVGALDVVGYVAWLGDEVFRRTLGFPVVVAGVGIGVIVGAVLVQRRFPALARRLDAARRGGPSLPGGALAAWAPALALLVALGASVQTRGRAQARREANALHDARRAARVQRTIQVPRTAPPVR